MAPFDHIRNSSKCYAILHIEYDLHFAIVIASWQFLGIILSNVH